jgi:hypothetical protein
MQILTQFSILYVNHKQIVYGMFFKNVYRQLVYDYIIFVVFSPCIKKIWKNCDEVFDTDSVNIFFREKHHEKVVANSLPLEGHAKQPLVQEPFDSSAMVTYSNMSNFNANVIHVSWHANFRTFECEC